MNNFKSGGFRKGGGNFGGKPKFGGDRDRGRGDRPRDNNFSGSNSDRRPTEMFSAECSNCHKTCTVPFKPNGEKPVFCSECFNKKNAENDRDGMRRNDDRGQRNDYSKPHRDERPARHDRPQSAPDNGLGEIKRQLAAIESRLNRILDLINPPMPAAKAAAVETEKVATPEKKAKPVKEKKVVDAVELKKAVKKATKPETKKAPAKKAVEKTEKKVVKKVAPKKK